MSDLIILTGTPSSPWGPGSPTSPSLPNSPVIPASPRSPTGPAGPSGDSTVEHSHAPWSPICAKHIWLLSNTHNEIELVWCQECVCETFESFEACSARSSCPTGSPLKVLFHWRSDQGLRKRDKLRASSAVCLTERLNELTWCLGSWEACGPLASFRPFGPWTDSWYSWFSFLAVLSLLSLYTKWPHEIKHCWAQKYVKNKGK